MKKVVITGIGVVSPIGTGVQSFLGSLHNSTSGIRYIDELETYNFSCRIGGIPDVSSSPYLSFLEKYNLADASTTILYACISALEAWEDAGLEVPEYNSPELDPDTGVIIGSGIGSMDIISNKIIPFVKEGKHKKLKSSIIEQLLFSASSSVISGILGTGNISTSNSNACATGTEAIILGAETIRRGMAKRMIVGGTEGYSPYYWATFDALRVTAQHFNHAPGSGCRPMSATACGLVPAAGAGILILEDMEQAIRRNAKIYAEIPGGFLNSGGQRNGGTMTAPNPKGVVYCINEALKAAAIGPGQIDCISGHLSSTMADVHEIKNWTSVLQRYNQDFPYINSLKSLTGHCLGATGAIESIAAVLELKNNFIHASANCEDLHPEIEKLIHSSKIPKTYAVKELNYIAKSSFGFGDVNACLILKKFTN